MISASIIKKPQVLMWLLLVVSYLISRLINLKIIPIFTDEAIYTYWSQVALHDPAHRFISLEDGKQPLFIWIAAIFQKFIADPLIASRLVSVFAGLGSLVGIYFLSKTLFSKRIAFISSFLYVVLPFTLLYDRMALFDSLLTMFGIYSVLLTVKLIKNRRFDTAVLTGIVVGLGMITKSSAVFFLYLIPFSLVLINVKKISLFNLPRLLVLFGTTFLTAQIIYNSLRLSPLFYIIDRKNLDFIRSIAEVIKTPFLHFAGNFHSLASWTIAYMGWPLFLFFLGSVIYAILKRNRHSLFLSFYVFCPFIAELLFNKVIYPRFILFYFPYIIILIAYGASQVMERLKPKTALLLAIPFLIIPIHSSIKLLTDPKNAPIAESDLGQYLNAWPAGFGVSEIVDFINSRKDSDIYIGTEGTFGLLPYALQVYFFSQEKVHIIGFWPVNEYQLPTQIMEIAKNKNTFFVFNENQNIITNPHLRLVAKYQKGRGDTFMRLYEIKP